MPSHVDTLLLALGANLHGPWGSPREALQRAASELGRSGLVLLRASHLYATAPVGPGRQASYLNAVLLLRSGVAPGALLRLVKAIERRAGRRLGTRWGPRPLDIDILDYGGRRLGTTRTRRRRGSLVLPHPEMHRRPFVLVPLLEVDPHWQHPVLGRSARTLFALSSRASRRTPVRQLDFRPLSCKKNP